MKAIFVTLSAGFLFLTGNLFAATINPDVKSKYECSTESWVSIAPTAPQEATFEDSPDVFSIKDIAKLAPKAPGEADFSDSVQDSTLNLRLLAPETPVKADFDDLNP